MLSMVEEDLIEAQISRSRNLRVLQDDLRLLVYTTNHSQIAQELGMVSFLCKLKYLLLVLIAGG